MEKYTLEYIKENNLIIFEAVAGSIAYGTNTAESDVDIRGCFICEKEDLYGMDYVDEVSDDEQDIKYYELGKFLALLEKNNPNIMEFLNMPEDVIRINTDYFKEVIKYSETFITKQCKNSFGGYSVAQIKKAKGQNKMMNWEMDKITRKTPLDFCFIIDGYKTRPLAMYLDKYDIKQKYCGIVNIPNAQNLFALFHDNNSQILFEDTDEKHRNIAIEALKKAGKSIGLGYKGIMKETEGEELISNELRLSSVEKGIEPELLFSYNLNGYQSHCKDYSKYQGWLKNRNDHRWVETEKHGQKYDGKNMMHSVRLTDMAYEIISGKGIIVRRPNAEDLLKIRRGESDLEKLIDVVENRLKEIDKEFETCKLPKKVDHKFVNDLLIEIRKMFYKEN